MMSVELKHHPEEWFFLHNFDIDKVFSTIQRADYLILYYIKMQAEQHPDSKVYLADLDRKSTRLNSSHVKRYRMPSSA